MKIDKECTGCLACYNVCPKNAIAINQNIHGFYRPKIDFDKCINCGMCETVCKSAFQKKKNYPHGGFIFSNYDQKVLSASSSGGAFHAIASFVLSLQGIIYAAGYDSENRVIHKRIDNVSDLFLITKSKYVQSLIGFTFRDIKKDLDSDMFVLFCGTPCQCSGLKAYLKKDYQKLLLVDFICHGVPSPLILEKHLNEISGKKIIRNGFINFRDKRNGIESYGFQVLYEDGTEYYRDNLNDKYLKAFSNNFFLQQCCYSCEFKDIFCDSDLTISDFWSKNLCSPTGFCDLDCSCIFSNSSKGDRVVEKLTGYGMMAKFNMFNELLINTSRFFPSSRPFKKIDFEANLPVPNNNEGLLTRLKRKICVKQKLFKLKRINKK